MTSEVNAVTWRVVALVGIVLAAFVTLSLFGVDTSELVTLVLTFAGLGGVTLHQAARADKQDDKLDTITHQTNGVLTKRIENGTRKVLREELAKLGLNPDDHPAK